MNVIDMHKTNSRFLSTDNKFSEICKEDYFVIRQHSDIIDNGIFDQLAILGKEPINYILSQPNPLLKYKNDIIEDKYFQLFISRDEYELNKDTFNGEEEGFNYRVVDNYNLVFRGFMRTENYYILANSNLDSYQVYVLLDNTCGKYFCNNSNKKIVFYGFINIGHLINPRPYKFEEILNFEEKVGFTLPMEIRKYILENSIFRLENQIFQMDLTNYSPKTLIPSNFKSKNLSNLKILTELRKDPNNQELLKSNQDFINSLENGFMYLGLKDIVKLPDNSVKQETRYYILVNFVKHTMIDFSFTIWEKTIINGNIGKRMEVYSEENKDKGLEELEQMVLQINPNDPCNIIYSMKCIKEF